MYMLLLVSTVYTTLQNKDGEDRTPAIVITIN